MSKLVVSGEEYAPSGAAGSSRNGGSGAASLVRRYQDDPHFPASLNGMFHGLAINRSRGTATLFRARHARDPGEPAGGARHHSLLHLLLANVDLFEPEPMASIDEARQTYARVRSEHPVTFAARMSSRSRRSSPRRRRGMTIRSSTAAFAAIPLTTFDAWWMSLPQESRKNTRRAKKRGVVVSVC